MLIHEPELTRAEGRVRLSARLEAKSPQLPKGEDIWIEYDEACVDGIGLRSDAFAALGYAIGIRVGEDVEIRGEVSPALLNGLFDHQRVLEAWYGNLLRFIEVRATSTTPAPAGGEKVGVSFSGGVDSYDVLFRRAEDPVASMRLTHAFMQGGFDYDAADESRLRVMRNIYAPVMRNLGVELLTVRTNMERFDVGRPVRTAGVLLVAPVLGLSKMFRRFYVPAAFQFGDLVPDGTHPLLDHMLGTEALQVIHDGSSFSRPEKTKSLVGRAETDDTLRVCRTRSWNNVDMERERVTNCGRCSKCVRTMTSLEIFGALERYQTFARPLERWRIRRAHSIGLDRPFTKQNLREAIRAGRKDLAFDLRWQLVRGWVFEMKSALLRRARRLVPFREASRYRHASR